MGPTDKLQFGILGCARICRRGMLRGVQSSGMSQLLALASRRPGQAAAWGAEFGVPQTYENYDAVIDNPAIDAVYIPLANEEHLPWVLRAAAAGKHILCEKPLALDVSQAETMNSACRRAGVILMEAFMWRHHPRVNQARQLLASGRLGDLRLIKMDFSFTIDPADWRLDPARGGGALFDLGCYGINAARLFTGAEPTEIIARGALGPTGVDLTDGFLLRFASGAMALLDCSFAAPYRNRLEIVGSRGSLELPGGVLPAENAPLLLHTDAGTESITVEHDCQYTAQVRAFCQGVRQGRLPDPAEDGLANMRVLCAVKDQAWSVR
ncbi:MAG: Gfo/Idh/MocA family oxidoreductase [Pirellulales bacterium]|nr:Gfo/Idh/MocA family oxidoreductase [Pirellulales bacterium]